MTYPKFGKIPRLHREVVITEKIDGTNGLIRIFGPDESMLVDVASGTLRTIVLPDRTSILVGSRTQWINPDNDNHGFAKWVWDNAKDLAQLGPGHHYGEWWGEKINRGYGIKGKRFSLFNVARWMDKTLPDIVDVVPVIARGNADHLNFMVQAALADLRQFGSFAAPGFMRPEGIVVYHDAAGQLFKVTLDNDEAKSAVRRPAAGGDGGRLTDEDVQKLLAPMGEMAVAA
jgi:hypothetical protein